MKHGRLFPLVLDLRSALRPSKLNRVWEFNFINVNNQIVLSFLQHGDVLNDVLLFQRRWNHLLDRCGAFPAFIAFDSDLIFFILDLSQSHVQTFDVPLVLFLTSCVWRLHDHDVISLLLLLDEVQVEQSNLVLRVYVGQDQPQLKIFKVRHINLTYPVQETAHSVRMIKLGLDSVAHKQDCYQL